LGFSRATDAARKPPVRLHFDAAGAFPLDRKREPPSSPAPRGPELRGVIPKGDQVNDRVNDSGAFNGGGSMAFMSAAMAGDAR